MNSLMEYLAPVTQAEAVSGQGADKYFGAVAANYDQKRTGDAKWQIEQRIIEDMLSDLPRDSMILDCPVGTGRFLSHYLEKGFRFVGMDLSGDMLIQSALKLGAKPDDLTKWVELCNAKNTMLPIRVDGDRGELTGGDIRNTGLPDKCVDATCNIRITRWLSPDDVVVMLKEMQRLARHKIIITARVTNHPHARSIELIQSALDGWVIHRNEAGYVTDYRIIELRPAA